MVIGEGVPSGRVMNLLWAQLSSSIKWRGMESACRNAYRRVGRLCRDREYMKAERA